jgi:plastocyanin
LGLFDRWAITEALEAGAVGLLAVAALAVMAGPAIAQECATTHEVEITFKGAKGFKPRELHVKVGECVRWINVTGIEHSAVAVDRSFHTGQLMPGSANVVRFDKLGEVPYTCGPHPPMVGKIVVGP